MKIRLATLAAGLVTVATVHAQTTPQASCMAPLIPTTVCAQSAVTLPTVTLPPPSPPVTVGVQAVAADAFLNTLGVVTHAGQGNPTSGYVVPIKYIGIRRIRDSGPQADLITLHQQTGVQVNLIWGPGTVPGLVDEARALAAAGALASIEGPNEPNNFQITYNGQKGGGTASWMPVALYQRDLYAAVKADATLRAYPVLSPTEVGAEQDKVCLQFLQIPSGADCLLPAGTKFADAGNVHNYVSGHNVYNDNQATNAANKWAQIGFDGPKGEFGGTTWLKGYPGYGQADTLTLPMATTETGWDSVSDPGGERVQGVVLVNTYLAQFKAGYPMGTYLYHMRDGEGGSDHQGLFNNNWTPKLAATYIHNLTSILAGPAGGTPGKLDYTIPNESALVHDILLENANGKFALVIWGESAAQVPHTVTINLATTHNSVNVYDVTSGNAPVQSYPSAGSIPLTLTDHALIVTMN